MEWGGRRANLNANQNRIVVPVPTHTFKEKQNRRADRRQQTIDSR
jgi:hypothetical protein